MLPTCRLIWVQEEPANMGAVQFLLGLLGPKVFEHYRLEIVARPRSASPATGSLRLHKQEQQWLIAEALDA